MSLRPSARTEVRRSWYKMVVDAEEGRQRREDNMVEIQKNKREGNLIKNRQEGLQSQQFQPSISPPQLDEKVDGLSDSALQKALDYACGAGADCNPTHQNGPCFQKYRPQSQNACNFAGTAVLTNFDPSVAGCAYPATARNYWQITPC